MSSARRSASVRENSALMTTRSTLMCSAPGGIGYAGTTQPWRRNIFDILNSSYWFLSFRENATTGTPLSFE
ncbi:hypothetical protein A2U01_0082208, partial [Trifolium medium]|nr:hypothetical protein [Trifolium medium]